MEPRDPTLADYLELFGFGVDVIVYLAVAFFVFPMWHRTKLTFFAWFGCGALTSLFLTVVSHTILRGLTAEQNLVVWSVQSLLYSFAAGCYGTAVVLLAKHFQQWTSAPPPVPPKGDPPTEQV